MLLDIRKGVCPVCGGREILEAVQGYLSRNAVYAAPLGIENNAEGQAVGSPRSYICAGCGYTQMFTDDVDTLRDSRVVRVLSVADDTDSPYR